ncbi:MAG: YopX family protein [Agathobacter sp.]|nr:YopX family protein [Agathobacter sp.]
MIDRYLYRAKRTDNREWVEGNLIIFEECAYIMELENTYIRTHYTCDDCVEFDMRAYKVDQSTICKCVNRKDEEGTLIFEHDIVSYLDGYNTDNGFSEGYPVGEVLWDDETLSFQVTERLSAESYEVLDGGDYIKVLGNRFDNPELLEVGE